MWPYRTLHILVTISYIAHFKQLFVWGLNKNNIYCLQNKAIRYYNSVVTPGDSEPNLQHRRFQVFLLE